MKGGQLGDSSRIINVFGFFKNFPTSFVFFHIKQFDILMVNISVKYINIRTVKYINVITKQFATTIVNITVRYTNNKITLV